MTNDVLKTVLKGILQVVIVIVFCVFLAPMIASNALAKSICAGVSTFLICIGILLLLVARKME